MIDRNIAKELERHILEGAYTWDEKIWLITDLVNLRRHLTIQTSLYLSPIELVQYRFMYGSKSRIFQSSLYLFILFLASYLSTESVQSRLQEISRFRGSLGLKFPGSLKATLKNIKFCQQWLPRRSKALTTKLHIRRVSEVKRDLRVAGFKISYIFLIGSYLRFRIVRSIVEGVGTKVEALYTIGTIEPFQKYLSSYLLYCERSVELYVHGIILDPIASYQCYSRISSETQYQGLRGVDNYLLSLFRRETPLFKEYGNIKENNTELSCTDFKGVRSLLIFSSSVESGMPVLEVDSLFHLLQRIEGYLHSSMSIVIRLHPGENRRLVFGVLNRHFSVKFKMDDDSKNDFDLAVGLPSTYIRVARFRAKRAFIISDVIYNSEYFKQN